ncbi:RDD family protein [Legionella waltersii]|uniref:RDD family protein n=1 Tax=Legionella waltersii TaxID=66969 RepID=A0A0W1A3U1_9GAMM|nr:RDD family protein [Legionella waltersii]KTD75667.1 RDD family protein [Legionella waltersii]SNU99247.1 RDD family [Legionella waltersii]
MFTIKYLCSIVYDLIVLIVLFFAYTALVLSLNHNKAIPPSTLWYQLSLLIVSFLYYFLSMRNGGQTIGMKAWGLKLVDKINIKLSFGQVLVRFFGFIPSIIASFVCLKWSYSLLNQWTNSSLIDRQCL